MQIDFPCDDAIWHAPNPAGWNTALRSTTPLPSFRNALRDLAGRGGLAPHLSEISLWVLLHGLISVSWTLLWRDLGDLSMVHESKITGWKDSLRRAFESWIGHVMGMAGATTAAGNELALSVFWSGVPYAHLGEPKIKFVRQT